LGIVFPVEKIKQATADAVRCHFDEDEMPRIIRLVREENVSL
jgi:hypothetical protein